ncbi:hypothetical protein KY290_037363 [Solanum tuberosum]|uniref:Uncharacterized protein n=1 Tax=Solanum tuberosum TaxID=4113 RepID=A0ABQ7TVY7_SOLTU|nr:hypothetical protein KY290_037363 [Solanum tuberosum]
MAKKKEETGKDTEGINAHNKLHKDAAATRCVACSKSAPSQFSSRRSLEERSIDLTKLLWTAQLILAEDQFIKR